MSEPKSTPQRFIGLDVHKHYLIAIAVNPAGEQIGGPWRAQLAHLAEWAHRHLTALDAVVLVLQRKFPLLRNFGYDYESLRFTLTGESSSRRSSP